MTVSKGLTPFSFPASASLATKTLHLVRLNSTGGVAVASAVGQQVIGVMMNKPSGIGQAAYVQTMGAVVKVSATTTGARPAITVGGTLIADSNGKATLSSTKGTAYVIGRALEAVTDGNSQIISMLITHEGPMSTA